MRPRRQAPRVRCIARFALLQLVVAAGEPVGVRELGRRAGLSRSTTGRMLGILAELGMVERTPDGAARPGAGLAALTRHVESTPAVLRQRLRPSGGRDATRRRRERRRRGRRRLRVPLPGECSCAGRGAGRRSGRRDLPVPPRRTRFSGDGGLARRRGSTGYLAEPSRRRPHTASPGRRRFAGDSAAHADATATHGPTKSSTSRSTASRHRSLDVRER